MNNIQDLLDSLEGTEIAVVGMSCRVPGAQTPAEFWQNLRDGVESTVTYTDEALREAGVDEALLKNPHYVKSGAPLPNMEMFDAGFFGFSPRDAAIMDPQHRHFIECAWEALECAGYDPAQYDGNIGVYAGSGHNIYMPYNLLTNPDLMKSVGFFLVRHTSNDKDFMTTRVSYLFNLKGPSLNVQTACSTSLVAIHTAVQSLLNGECDMALAGGVTIELPHQHGYLYELGEILSPDGHCRAFDADSQGTIFGSGVGIVLLKRLEDALLDGDTIHAIVKGSAINNDGSEKVGYLAPSVDGQAGAIGEALAMANVDPESINYIEAHGTGTPVGDPIEVAALTQVFRNHTDKVQFCAIGSAKTNIGHLDTAAGVMGFIKTIMALKHRQIPATLHFKAPNPRIDFASSPFFVNDTLRAWEPAVVGKPRRAGVSSLGVGGTNAHVILEEAPKLPPTSNGRPHILLVWSARTPEALDNATVNLAAFLRDNPDVPLADVAYTLQVGRKPFTHRRILVCTGREDAIAALASNDPTRILSQQANLETPPSVAFLFTGGGAQYPNMGRDLYDSELVYREAIDRCLEIVAQYLDDDLRSVMFPAVEAYDAAAVALKRPSLALPALVMTEYATAKLWMSWGVNPAVMSGHSMGEYVAAHFCGVMSLETALEIVTLRGQLFETLPAGAMLSIPVPEEQVRPLLLAGLDIAAINAPSLCVVSGEVARIEKMAAVLDAEQISYRQIPISVAAHSAMLDPILETFEARLKGMTFAQPHTPYISNVTGTWVRPEDAADPRYWVRHLRHTVRFADGVGTLLADENRLFVEVGPGRTLATLVRRHSARTPAHGIVTSLRHPKDTLDDSAFFANALGRLWLAGIPVSWQDGYARETRRRVALPTYPFEHQRYWIEPGSAVYTAQATADEASLTKVASLDKWFYLPSWRRTLPPVVTADEDIASPWLLFLDTEGVGQALASQLMGRGAHVFTVRVDKIFSRHGDTGYTLDPSVPEHYDQLITDLTNRDAIPQAIVYLWSLGMTPHLSHVSVLSHNMSLNFYSLLYLAQALGNAGLSEPMDITFISNNMQAVAGETFLHPEKAMLLGPCRVMAQEYPFLTSRSIDITLLSPDRPQYARSIYLLANELIARSDDDVIAYRGASRWVQTFESAPLRSELEVQSRFKKDGIYLITGGLGGIALAIAAELATQYNAKLALVGRTPLPVQDEWDSYLAQSPAGDKTARRIRQVKRLLAQGADVLVWGADVTNVSQMRHVVDEVRETFGGLDGVIHTAGALDDSIIQLKDAQSAGRVLAPKVGGTLVLDAVLRDGYGQPFPLDFIVLFSSVSSFTGLVGQVDYAAANAFLDAFAHYKTLRDGIFTVAVNWGVWQEVGMAAELARKLGVIPTTDYTPVAHPLLGGVIEDGAADIYVTEFRVEEQWLLDEHRIRGGHALIPGTGYLEIVRAAVENKPRSGLVTLQDIYFLQPFVVRDGESRELRVVLNHGTNSDFVIESGKNGTHAEHVRGRVTYTSEPESRPSANLEALLARCTERTVEVSISELTHLNFGPRWDNLRRVHYGVGEAVAELVLPEPFAIDLEAYKLHPAVLDMATAGAQALISGFDEREDFYVPFSYSAITLYDALPRKVYSHIRYRPNDVNSKETAVFDVLIMDERGRIVVDIEQFVMRRIADKRAMGQPSSRGGNREPHLREAETKVNIANKILEELQNGILPHEGLQALQRILAADESQVIVSSQDLPRLIQLMRAQSNVSMDDSDEQTSGGVKFARPNLPNPYVAPTTETERTVANIWQELLGIDAVGIHDDFFELGGHSLLLTQIVGRVRKATGVAVSLATLFESPTISALVGEIAKAQEQGMSEPAVPQLKRISRAGRKMKRNAIKKL